MAFYFVNDGAVDTAVTFQEDLEAIWASGFIAANAEIWTQSGVGSRPNVVAGVELRQPYSQQFVEPIEAQFYPSYLQSWAADVTLDFSLSATGVGPIIIRSADPDAPSWKRQFYDKQLKEFEDSLDEIVSADDPQEAAQEAVEAFQPLETPSPIIRDNLQAISEALRGMTMRSLRRKELQAEIADIRAELARVAEYRRKRRNNEAALLLLL